MLTCIVCFTGSNASFVDCQCGQLGLVSNNLQSSTSVLYFGRGLITDLELERVTL